jgi:hypothetical protein
VWPCGFDLQTPVPLQRCPKRMGAAYRDIQWNQFREINKHKAVQNQMFLELVCDYRYRLEDTKSVAVNGSSRV